MNLEQVDIQDIYDFMEHGSPANAPEHIVAYLELLDKVRGMMHRIDVYSGDEAIIKHLILSDKLSRYKAKKVIDEAREYFYRDSNVSKDAWRNIYAEKMEKVVNFAMQIMKDVSDADRITKMIQRLSYIRALDKVDPETFPEELFRPPVKVYTLDPRVSEFVVPANRNVLAKIIDELPELTEKEKDRLKAESLINTLTIFPDVKTDARKS